ncbi:MAG: hypothetical protein ACYCZQ_03310 [Burkholderiales bacterium]
MLEALIKKGWKSKTVWFGYLISLFGGIQMWLPQIQQLVSQVTYGKIFAAVGFIIVVLRVVTTNSLADK